MNLCGRTGMVPLAVNVMGRRACFQLLLLKSFSISNYLWAFQRHQEGHSHPVSSTIKVLMLFNYVYINPLTLLAFISSLPLNSIFQHFQMILVIDSFHFCKPPL